MAASMAAVLSLPLASALLTPRSQGGVWPAAAAAATAAVDNGGSEGKGASWEGGGGVVGAGALGFLCISLALLALASRQLGGACWKANERTGGRSRAGRTAGDFWHWA